MKKSSTSLAEECWVDLVDGSSPTCFRHSGLRPRDITVANIDTSFRSLHIVLVGNGRIRDKNKK